MTDMNEGTEMEITSVSWKQISKLLMQPSWRKQMIHLLKFLKNCHMKWQVHEQKSLIELLSQSGFVWLENIECSAHLKNNKKLHEQLLTQIISLLFKALLQILKKIIWTCG